MSDLDYLMGVVERQGQRIGTKPVNRWATVITTMPLTIQLDGDPAPLLGTPASAAPKILMPGERVRVEIQNNRVTVLAAANRVEDLRGTTAQRLALASAGVVVDGMRFYDTDDTQTYVGAAGVWRRSNGLIASGTITAQSTFNIDGLTGADRYEVTLFLPTSSVANDLYVRLRSGGVIDMAPVHDRQALIGGSTTAAATNTMGSTFWGGIVTALRADKTIRLTVLNLNRAERTIVEATAEAWDSSASPYLAITGLRHRAAAAFDGLWFETTIGTVTGRYEVRAL